MTHNRTVFNVRRALPDRYPIDDLSAWLATGAGVLLASYPSPGSQMPNQFLLEHAWGLDEQAAIDRFMGRAQAPFIWKFPLEPSGYLLWRPIPAAIWRIEASAARPQDISSRSASVSARRDRRRVTGMIPPFDDTTPCTDPACLPSARPMSLKDCPAFHLCHCPTFWDAESPGRPICALPTTFQI